MSDTSPDLPFTLAEDMQMAAFLRELHGAQPAPDLVERILACAAARPVRSGARVRRLWLAAALLLGGVGAVVAVVVQQAGRPLPRAALPVENDATQDPPASQDRRPDLDPALRARIERAIRRLENGEERAAAIAELGQIGAVALPSLGAALQAEVSRGRADVLAGLQAARTQVARNAAKIAFGLPAEPVTLIADYSDNRLFAVDAKGKEVWEQGDVFGAWDAELTPTGTLLVTEFSVSRVQEIDGRGKVLWSFDDLKNPYDADRLDNGNTLIADTFAGRVIEVNAAKKIVWQFADNVRPFDCDRLASGNTLIADVLGERVIEVDREGKVVWKVEGMKLVHDADRLPDGNTLITLRQDKKVIEVDRDGKIVFELKDLSHPSDSDRLPNGNTLVAENGLVREFDRAGVEVWRQKATWAVEAARY